MRLCLLLLFLPFCSFSQNDIQVAKFEKASDEIQAEILMAENSLKNQTQQYWVRTEKIVCLSGIKPKQIDHQYSGLSYKPTPDDLKKWKAWFKKNQKSLKYIEEAGVQIIVFEELKGETKKSNCNYK
jgi:hypothetical protein